MLNANKLVMLANAFYKLATKHTVRAYRSRYYGGQINPSKSASLGIGYYFTTSEERARKYSQDGCIIWVDVTFSNPLIGKKRELAQLLGLQNHRDDDTGAYDYTVGDELNRIARDKGFDGIVAISDDGQANELVAFDRSQFIIVNSIDCKRN